jgi:tetratricopeptide (TPR) repeat protein
MARSRRRVALFALGIAAALGLVVLAVTGGPRPWTRRSVVRARQPGPALPAGPQAIPVEQWTARFLERQAAGDWAGLDADLATIQSEAPDLFDWYRLGYLQARARLQSGRLAEGRQALEPYLAPGHPFRDLALFHAAEAAATQGQADEAARLREELILQHPQGTYRTRALEDHLQVLSEAGNAEALVALAGRVQALDAGATRDLESRVVEAVAPKDPAAALERGLRLLKANAADDPADRAARALDRPGIVDGLGPEDTMLLGETLRNHRHFDRAIALLERARPRLPGKQDDLLFSIGRAYFASERFPEAEKVYLEGASVTRDSELRASFLYQASRCAQLLLDDERAERHLGQAVAAGGTTTRGSASLTQRARLRARQGRFAEAAADVRAVRARFPRSHAVVEATLGYAIALVGAERHSVALRELELIKPRLLEKRDVPEVQYWKARTLEKKSPAEAVRLYLKVLKADTPTHFAYFARQRLAGPLAGPAAAEDKRLAAQVQQRLARGDTAGARRAQTDAALIAPPPREREELDRLAALYRQAPEYRQVLELPPPEYPRFPIFGPDPSAEPGRFEVLLASGLFDDAVDLVLQRYPLHPLASGVARSEALRRGAASRASIYAIEVVAREDIPDDFVPQLLPRLVKELIYPRYFHGDVVRQSQRYGADPRLVLSIMREESRFNPRAKSAAAARGLLQFIITTARQVGEAVGLVDVTAEDLYEPPVIIQLGAKYIADLLGEFNRNSYRAAAAYNAGPHQARLWARMAPAEGNDFYLSSINFDETKDYVRKVLNSYERYGEIYESRPPAGGVRAEP